MPRRAQVSTHPPWTPRSGDLPNKLSFSLTPPSAQLSLSACYSQLLRHHESTRLCRRESCVCRMCVLKPLSCFKWLLHATKRSEETLRKSLPSLPGWLLKRKRDRIVNRRGLGTYTSVGVASNVHERRCPSLLSFCTCFTSLIHHHHVASLLFFIIIICFMLHFSNFARALSLSLCLHVLHFSLSARASVSRTSLSHLLIIQKTLSLSDLSLFQHVGQ